MPDHDEIQLRHLQLRVQEELSQARAERDLTASPTTDDDLGNRLEQIERELTKLQQSHGLLYRGRRTQAVQSLLLSERLLLDDLGYDTYDDYLAGPSTKWPTEPDEVADREALVRLELASAQDRFTDIENGVLDLDWLANGCPDRTLVDPLEIHPAFSADEQDSSDDTDAPLEAWRNPFAADAEPQVTVDRRFGSAPRQPGCDAPGRSALLERERLRAVRSPRRGRGPGRPPGRRASRRRPRAATRPAGSRSTCRAHRRRASG